MTIFRKTSRSAKKSIIAYTRNNAFEHKDAMEIKKKKHILLIDGASDWLQIWMAASSLDIKGNRAIKQKCVFLTNRLVFPITVTNMVYVENEHKQ